MASGGVISKPKAARQKRNANYYKLMFEVQKRKKLARKNKAENRKRYWIKRGTKKNGRPVKGA